MPPYGLYLAGSGDGLEFGLQTVGDLGQLLCRDPGLLAPQCQRQHGDIINGSGFDQRFTDAEVAR